MTVTPKATANLMRIVGWGLIPALLFLLFYGFPEGFAWGIEAGTQHHPYVWMMLTLYIAWCYLLVRESKNPEGAGLLFDWGIIANALHGLLMVGQSLMMWETRDGPHVGRHPGDLHPGVPAMAVPPQKHREIGDRPRFFKSGTDPDY